jgi:glycine/D-amino acid oxidase-like deaminating enzyme
MDAPDVAVIGAGLSGLICARALEESGMVVRVLERSDRVGGRIGTDHVDGYRCDRGLQWFDASDPDVRANLDVSALNPRQIQRGVVLAHPEGYRILQGSQASLIAVMRAGLGDPQDIARLVRWTEPLRRPRDRVLHGTDMTLAESLDRFEISARIREQVLHPLVRLLFADESLDTSYQYAMLVMQGLVFGTPSLPALGMQALPDQVARSLETPIERGVRVIGLERDTGTGVRIHTADEEVRARAVVVATDPGAAAAMLGLGAVPMRSLTTWWFSTEVSPTSLRIPFVNPLGPGAGPVSHALVVSNVAPRYAPAGRHLVAAASLGPGGRQVETAVRDQLAQVFRNPSVAGWDLVARHESTRAWPAVRPPLIVHRDVDLGDGVFVAGDHRETGGIAAALRSGRRAAAAVLDDLGWNKSGEAGGVVPG